MKILVLLGHPRKKSLCGSLADTYEKEAKNKGAEVRRVNLRDLKFDPILWEGYAKVQKLEKDLVKVQEDIKWADHIVFVYPTWWHSVPALMKGFIDRTILPGFGFNYRPGKLLPLMRLKGRSGRIITTLGEPVWIFWLLGRPSVKQVMMGTFRYCGIKPVKVTMFGKIFPKIDEKSVGKYIDKVVKAARKDVR